MAEVVYYGLGQNQPAPNVTVVLDGVGQPVTNQSDSRLLGFGQNQSAGISQDVVYDGVGEPVNSGS